MTTLYVISIKTGELLRTREASIDIKTEQPVIPPYQTPVAIPESDIPDTHRWLYLDEQGKPARYHHDGSWVQKPRPEKVTAYHKQTRQPKQFDDASLVTDEYTLKAPATEFDDWDASLNDWVTDVQAKYEYDVASVEAARHRLYIEIVDRLNNEAEMIRRVFGDETKASECETQANAAYVKIRNDNPWPEPPAV